MGRDYRNFERNERRGFGGTDNWDSDLNDGIDQQARDRPMRRSGWQGSPVTSYREADPRERRDAGRGDWDEYDERDRARPVNWGRERDDERRQGSRGYELDHDVYRAGDRDEWRGEFGPKEDRTRWNRGQERDWRGTMRGETRERRDWQTSSRDRYPNRREMAGDPYQEQRYAERDADQARSQRFGEMDDVRVRYGTDYSRDVDWSGDTDYGWGTDNPRRDDDRDRNWGRANRSGWNASRISGRATGQHAGRGPRGYQRSDERIREDVSEILWAHDEIDASEIDVMVENGEVTLEGTVDSRWTKRMAEDAAHEARGVHDVHNRLRIRREQSGGWDRGTDTMTQFGNRPTEQRAATGDVMLEGGRTATGRAFAPDMTVVGSDGDEVGIVKEVREDTILVDRPMARDVYIPFSAVRITDGSTARLTINSGDVDNQGWQNPPMTGTDTDYDESVQLT